jgi:hypothetical protein
MNVLAISVYTPLVHRIPDPGRDVDPHFKLSSIKVYRNCYIYLGPEMKDQDAYDLFRFRSVLSPDSDNGSVRGPRDIFAFS